MTTYTHSCIKCSEQYIDTDPDPYYCSTCKSAAQETAKRIDTIVAGRGPKRPIKSALQEYDEATDKVRGFLRVRL